MIYRVLKFGILASIIQIVLYMILTGLFQYSQVLFKYRNDLPITDKIINLVWGLFMICVLIKNLLSTIVNKKWFTYFMLVLTLIVLSKPWLHGFKLFPCLPFILINVVILVAKFIIERSLSDKVNSNYK